MVDHFGIGKPPWYVTNHPGQLTILPSAGQEISTGQSVAMLQGWEIKASMAHSICGRTCGWQVDLCDPSLTGAIPEQFVVSQTQSTCNTNALFSLL